MNKLATGMLGLLVSAWSVGGQAVNSDEPVWSRPILPDPGSNRHAIFDTNRAGVVFLSNDKLIPYGVELDTGQLSSRKSPEVSSPFRLRLWVLDAKSGAQTLTRDFGTRVRDSEVQVTTGGVLVKTGAVLKLYSPDFTNARDLSLPLDKGEWITARVSPTGKTILVNRINGRLDLSHLDVFDADTLNLRRSWQDYGLYHDYSISDEGIVAAAKSHNGFILGAKFGSTSWDVLSQSERGCYWGSPSVVGNESFVARHCGDLFLRTGDGVASSVGSLSLGDSNPPASSECHTYDGRMNYKTAVASEGRFIALTLAVPQVRKHILSEPSVCLVTVKLALYDLVLKKRVLSVSIEHLPRNDYDFALSPDGSKLAILNDGTVSLFSFQGGRG